MTRSPCAAGTDATRSKPKTIHGASPSISAIGNRKPQCRPCVCVGVADDQVDPISIISFIPMTILDKVIFKLSPKIAGKHLGRQAHGLHRSGCHRDQLISGQFPSIVWTPSGIAQTGKLVVAIAVSVKLRHYNIQAATGDSQTSCHYRLQSKTSRFVPLSNSGGSVRLRDSLANLVFRVADRPERTDAAAPQHQQIAPLPQGTTGVAPTYRPLVRGTVRPETFCLAIGESGEPRHYREIPTASRKGG